MKVYSGTAQGNRVELPEGADLPKNTPVLVIVAEGPAAEMLRRALESMPRPKQPTATSSQEGQP